MTWCHRSSCLFVSSERHQVVIKLLTIEVDILWLNQSIKRRLRSKKINMLKGEFDEQ